jgi:hypothetical protein
VKYESNHEGHEAVEDHEERESNTVDGLLLVAFDNFVNFVVAFRI